MLTNVSKTIVENPFEVVTLKKAKKQLRIDDLFTEEDDLILGYIEAAIAATENYINGDLQPKTLTIVLSEFQDALVFEAYPIISITSIKYYKNDVEIQMPETDYYKATQNLKQSKLVFKTQPETDNREDAVTIKVSVGFQNLKSIPAPLIQAVLLQISDMYERREDRPEMIATAAQSLMRTYRKYT